MKRKIFALLLALCLLAGLLSGCGQAAPAASEPPAEESPAATEPAAEESQTPETREFTDSTGRTVTVRATYMLRPTPSSRASSTCSSPVRTVPPTARWWSSTTREA